MSPGIFVTHKLSTTFLPCFAINNSSPQSYLHHVKMLLDESEIERSNNSKGRAVRHLEVKEVTKNDKKKLEKDKNIGEKKCRAMRYIRKKMSTQVCNSRYKCVKEKIIA